VPGGVEGMRRSIATMPISNESDLADISNYRVTVMESANRLTGQPPGIAETVVLAHPRRQRVWALVQKACEEIMNADWVEL
jgi:hypothetical protein